MKIILTNDDGIDAPGLEALSQILRAVSTPIIVAPEQPQSGISHSVTTRSLISINRLGENRFSVGGTPADCARLAVKEIAPDAAWLISGINPGANLGSDRKVKIMSTKALFTNARGIRGKMWMYASAEMFPFLN